MSKLGDLFAECLRLIDTASPEIACPQIVDLLRPVLTGDLPGDLFPARGYRVVHDRGLAILAHHHPTSVWSMPHDHGRTWAIYGVVAGRTAMYDYEGIGDGKCTLTRSYWVHPGHAYWFPTGAIHSHKTYDDSKLIRIEGINMHRKGNKIGGKNFKMVTNDPIREH